MHERAGVDPDVVGPQDECQNASPEAQVQVPDSKQPGGKPEASREGVLLNAYLLRIPSAGVGIQASLQLIPCQFRIRTCDS